MKNPIQNQILLAACAALLPAGLSAAPSKITIGFDTDGNNQGFTGTNVTGLATAAGLISGTASNGDPRIIRSNATAFITKPALATWQTVSFRVRETDESSNIVAPDPFDLKGVLAQVNSTNSSAGATTDTSRAAVASGDGFYTYTSNIPDTFTANEIKYLRVDPIGGSDAAGNKFEVDFIEVTMTNTPPALVSTSPADNATSVAPTATLTATFDEPVSLNTTGSVTIKNLTTTNETVISLPGPDPDGTLSVLGNVLTIDPAADIAAPGEELAIEISADAIKDADDVFYAGILSSDDPNWSFTIDNTPPVPSYFHPIHASGNAPLDGALFIAFTEAPLIGTGNLVVHRASDDSVVETINAASATVTGNTVSVVPTVPLAYNTSYYVLIDTGAFADALGNGYGITDPNVWTFTTIANDPTVLFGDSFNRAADADLNASPGKYGSLGALNYTARLIGLSNVQLSDGQLLVQANDGAGQPGGLVYLNHNFTDASISTGTGFSITVDLNAYDTNGTGRYLSVGVGQSVAELDAQPTSSALSSVGDLVVAYRSGTGNLEFFKNGVRDAAAATAGQPAPPTKMRIDYSLPDFNSGSTVDYSVFFDDSVTAIASGTFTWSGTNENYISLSSNLFLGPTVGLRNSLFDNLQIRTLATGGGSDFAAWQSANLTAGGLDEDHDGDGVSNGVEFFIYGPVANSGFTALPGVDNTGGVFSVTFTKAATYNGSYGADFEVEVSTTLASWSPAPGGTVTFPSATEVKYTFPAGTKNFARLKVTGP